MHYRYQGIPSHDFLDRKTFTALRLIHEIGGMTDDEFKAYPFRSPAERDAVRARLYHRRPSAPDEEGRWMVKEYVVRGFDMQGFGLPMGVRRVLLAAIVDQQAGEAERADLAAAAAAGLTDRLSDQILYAIWHPAALAGEQPDLGISDLFAAGDLLQEAVTAGAGDMRKAFMDSTHAGWRPMLLGSAVAATVDPRRLAATVVRELVETDERPDWVPWGEHLPDWLYENLSDKHWLTYDAVDLDATVAALNKPAIRDALTEACLSVVDAWRERWRHREPEDFYKVMLADADSMAEERKLREDEEFLLGNAVLKAVAGVLTRHGLLVLPNVDKGDYPTIDPACRGDMLRELPRDAGWQASATSDGNLLWVCADDTYLQAAPSRFLDRFFAAPDNMPGTADCPSFIRERLHTFFIMDDSSDQSLTLVPQAWSVEQIVAEIKSVPARCRIEVEPEELLPNDTPYLQRDQDDIQQLIGAPPFEDQAEDGLAAVAQDMLGRGP